MKTVDPRLWALYEKAVGWVRRIVYDEDDARTIVLKVIGSIDVSCLRDADVTPFLRHALQNRAFDFRRKGQLSMYDAPVPDRAGGDNPEDIVSARQQAAKIDVQFPTLFTESEKEGLNATERKTLKRMRDAVKRGME